MSRFRQRTRALEEKDSPLEAYARAALSLGETADTVAARCWVGVLAEAVRDPALFARVRRLLDTEIAAIRRRSGDRFSAQDASTVLAFVLGALVFGAFAPTKAAGFAAPALLRLIESIGETK